MNRKKIIIADDEPSLLWVLSEIICAQFNNIEIYKAYNGYDVLRIINNYNKIDMIISDVQMPKLNGLDLLKEIKKLNKDIPTLLITGNPEIKRNQIINLGAIDLLYKPFRKEDISTIVKRIIEPVSLP